MGEGAVQEEGIPVGYGQTRGKRGVSSPLLGQGVIHEEHTLQASNVGKCYVIQEVYCRSTLKCRVYLACTIQKMYA